MTRMRRTLLLVGVAALCLGGLLAGALLRPARAISTTDILKIGGSLLVVNQFGDQINHAINSLLGTKKAELRGATKVVPIVSVGQGAYIGAAQVVGVPGSVKRVQAVAAVEGVVAKLQGTLLVPISTKVPGSKLARVEGVGVSTILDLKL